MEWKERRGGLSILQKSFWTTMSLSVRHKNKEVLITPGEPPPHRFLLYFGSLDFFLIEIQHVFVL